MAEIKKTAVGPGEKSEDKPAAKATEPMRFASENDNVVVKIEDGRVTVEFAQSFIESHYIMGGGIKKQVFIYKEGSRVDATAYRGTM